MSFCWVSKTFQLETFKVLFTTDVWIKMLARFKTTGSGKILTVNLNNLIFNFNYVAV